VSAPRAARSGSVTGKLSIDGCCLMWSSLCIVISTVLKEMARLMVGEQPALSTCVKEGIAVS
jgi:hypothetical protein